MGKTYEYCYEEAIGINKLKDALSTAGIIILKETSIQHGTKFIFQNGATIILYCSKSKTSKIYVEKENTEIVAFLENLCMQEKRIESIPIYASFTVHSDKFLDIKQAIISSFVTTEKPAKKDTITYILDVTEENYHITVTQFNSGKLLLQGIDSLLVDKIKEIINIYAPISNKEEALTYVAKEKQAETQKAIEQIIGFDEYCDKAKKALSTDAYDYLSLTDKKQIVTAFGLLQAIKENSIELPVYNPIVYPVAKAFEGFILKMMMDKRAFTLEEYQKNPEIANIGNWLRGEKFSKYIKDIRRDGAINKSLIAAWEGIRCLEMHSDPARNTDISDLITIEQAEMKIGAVCDAITTAYHVIIKNGYSEEQMLVHKSSVSTSNNEIKEIPILDCHIGTDESGKGDYFGPLVIAGVYVSKYEEQILAELGVRDSKNNSDSKNVDLAQKIREILGKDKFSIICIGPERYNSLYEEMGKNLNRLLGWGHARAIENLLAINMCEHAIADQFGDETIINSALMEKGKQIKLLQTPKGERDIGVAAASILARARFLEELDKIEKTVKIPIAKGVNPVVEEAAKKIYFSDGIDKLKCFVKLHFKTTQKIIN